MGQEIVRADLHSHNYYSKDSVSTPKQVVKQCLAQNIHCLAVTNHNTIQGAEETRQEARSEGYDLMVITGEEITTGVKNSAGKKIEIIGFGLEEAISPGLSLTQTLQEIKNQGGIACVPHPFELWRHGVGKELGEDVFNYALELHIPLMWESSNGRSSRPNNNLSREFYFRNRGLLLNSAGSDAHHAEEIGRASLMLKGWGGSTIEEQKKGFLKSIHNPIGFNLNDDWSKTLRFRMACKIGRLLKPRISFPPAASA